MIDLLSSVLFSLGFVLLASVFLRRFRANERSWLWGAVAIHILAALSHVWVTRHVFGGGDVIGYHRTGGLIAAFIRSDFSFAFPRVIAVLFQKREYLPVEIAGMGSSTGSMRVISALLQLVVGPSLYGLCIVISAAGFFSRLLLYRVLRVRLPEEFHRAALWSCLFVPSVVFWTAGLLKESIAMIGMCVAMWAGHSLAVGSRRLVALAVVVPSLTLIGLTKAYVLIPLGLAGAVWYYVHRSSGGTGRMRRLRPVQLVLAVLLGVSFVFGVGELFPRFQINQFADEAAHLQTVGQTVDGGSNYNLGTFAQDTPTGVYALGPVALVTALFRPQLFDVTSPVVALSAAEMTVLTWLVVVSLRRRGFNGIRRVLTRSHTLLFCAVFVLAFGTGVGLTTTNFGTLTRYRVPMMPMYTLLLLVLTGVGKTRSRTAATGAPTSPLRPHERRPATPSGQAK